MDVIVVAICIVAAALAGLAWLLCERVPLPAWACAGVAILVALLVFAAGPRVLGG